MGMGLGGASGMGHLRLNRLYTEIGIGMDPRHMEVLEEGVKGGINQSMTM